MAAGIENVEYLGLDIVPGLIDSNRERYASRSNLKFAVQDFIDTPLPLSPDLILNRDMVQHQTMVDGLRTYANLEASGARYLATTWLDHPGPNAKNAISEPGAPCGCLSCLRVLHICRLCAHAQICAVMAAFVALRPYQLTGDRLAGGYYPVNVFLTPFNFSRPEFIIREGIYEGSTWASQRKVIGLFKLPALLMGDGRGFEISEADWERAGSKVVDIGPDRGKHSFWG